MQIRLLFSNTSISVYRSNDSLIVVGVWEQELAVHTQNDNLPWQDNDSIRYLQGITLHRRTEKKTFDKSCDKSAKQQRMHISNPN